MVATENMYCVFTLKFFLFVEADENFPNTLIHRWKAQNMTWFAYQHLYLLINMLLWHWDAHQFKLLSTTLLIDSIWSSCCLNERVSLTWTCQFLMRNKLLSYSATLYNVIHLQIQQDDIRIKQNPVCVQTHLINNNKWPLRGLMCKRSLLC